MASHSPPRRSLLLAGAAAPLLVACKSLASAPRATKLAQRQVRASAPFAMPAISVPDFSGSRQFPISAPTRTTRPAPAPPSHNCRFDHDGSNAKSSIANLLYVKTNERRGGYVRNIRMSNTSAIRVGEAKFICRIKGEAALPVHGVTPVVTQNQRDFVNRT